VDEPSRTASIEFRRTLERHDHVDLALGMAMVGTCEVFHLDHVDTEAVRRFTRLDDATVLYPSAFAIAHPSRCNARATRIDHRSNMSYISQVESNFTSMSIATDLAAPSAPPAAQAREDANLLAGIGRRVREARERRSMARKTLSQSSNVSERYLAHLEAGEAN